MKKRLFLSLALVASFALLSCDGKLPVRQDIPAGDTDSVKVESTQTVDLVLDSTLVKEADSAEAAK